MTAAPPAAATPASPGTPATAAAPQFSIITVCFNALAVLPTTLASLRAQTGVHLEWVVIDGASTDGSAAWLAARQPDVLVSEPDAGIYDAMNKGVARARGEWLYFLNAGDCFADPRTLADVAAAIAAAPRAQLLYGDVVYFGNSGEQRHRFHWLSRGRLLFGDLCHQAAFARRALFAQVGGFDASLRWNADFDWFLRAFKAGACLRYVARDIARFHDAGAHVQAGAQAQAERHRVRQRYLPLPLWRLGHGALRVELKLRRMLGQTT